MLIILLNLSTQNSLDSLKSIIHNSRSTQEKVKIYYTLSNYYIHNNSLNPDSCLTYSFLAYGEKNKLKDVKKESIILKNIGTALIYKQEFDSSLLYLNKSLEIASGIDSVILTDLYNLIGATYYYKGDFEKTLKYWDLELAINYKINNKDKIAQNLNNLGVIHKNLDQYEKAIKYYQKALKIEEDEKDTASVARALNNIGNIYFHNRKNYEQAEQYYRKALELYSKLGELEYEADLLNNIGIIYYNQSKLQKALNNYTKALKIFTELNRKEKIAETHNNLGLLYSKLGNFEIASDFIKKSFEFYKITKSKPKIAESLRFQGDINLEAKKYQKALNNYYNSLQFYKELNSNSDLAELYVKLSETYAKLRNFKKAFEYHTLSTNLNDSLFSEKVNEQIAKFQTLYESEKKDKEIAILNKDKALQDAVLKRQKSAIISFIVGFALIFFFLVLIFRLFQQKRKANKILEQQNKKISLQRDQIFEKNIEINDSIEYARKIQDALLPPKRLFENIIPDSFVFFKPRDIVSGDYYWLKKNGNKIISVTADCTGHGVPGAFMSMLGISFLNEIVNILKTEDLNAGKILDEMRSRVISSLHQTGNVGENSDGMDLTLCIIDKKKMTVNYAGAYNPLYIVRKGELLETKADKMPIGIHAREVNNFTNHIISIEKDDVIYTFTDGYIDQFGGEDDNKFRKKNFNNLLLEIYTKDMPEQKEILKRTIEEWMKGYDQVDDILVSGIRI